MPAGYIYVLVNSSMPGLVKVGKTTRLPSERSTELSGVTGVATPFIVAFEQYFSNCDAAESFIHAELERRGWRESDRREFFRAPANEVIRIILRAPGIADPPAEAPPKLEDSDDDHDLLHLDASNDLFLETARRRPWSELYEMAENAYYGHEDHIQDYGEALKLFKDCARLGSALAYEKIGQIYEYGEGIKEDKDRALRYYKEGTTKGDYFCWGDMAKLFARYGQIENARKCFERYSVERSKNQSPEFEEFKGKHVMLVYWCTRYLLYGGLQPDFGTYLAADADALIKYACEVSDRPETELGKDEARRVRDWLIEQNRKKSGTSDETKPSTFSSAPPRTELLAVPLSKPKKWRWGRR